MDLSILLEFWHIGLSGVALGGAIGVTAHVLLYKRQSHSSVAWIGLAWLSPLIGVFLYLSFGINRIQRRARAMRRNGLKYKPEDKSDASSSTEVELHLGDDAHLGALQRLIGEESRLPLTSGNAIQPLFCGDQAYPEMLSAIENAQSSVTLMTYIFDNDRWGQKFAQALIDATKRGIEVRVLIDAAGLGYSIPSIFGTLRSGGVRVEKFLPAKLFPPRLRTINLRNHRKIMVADGHIGFTGGANIRAGCVLEENPKHPTRDTHFRVCGPVVRHLQDTFADDWLFMTGERLPSEGFYAEEDEKAGTILARGISDGPDENLDHLRWAIMGAASVAQKSIRIVTPYFLPDKSLMEALIVARKRGVEIDVIIPMRSNLPYVDWACMGLVGPLIQRGVRLHRVPGVFDHSKLMVVDSAWTLLGSANIDPRSLVLNFEFNLECYDAEFGGEMDAWVLSRRDLGERLRWEEWSKFGLFTRLRNGAFRLFTPYL